MKKVIVIVGYGPGISSAVAEKFGAQGYAIALVARSADRLEAGVKALRAKGIEAASFVADAGRPESIRAAVAAAHKTLGPISTLLWNAYGRGAGDLTTASSDDVRGALDVAITGLLGAVQEALPDLRAQKGSVLVTNGGFGLLDVNMDRAAVNYGAMGLALANAAKTKLVRMLAEKLRADGVYVGEAVVMGTVKGSAFDASGNGNLDSAKVANAFWDLQSARDAVSVSVKP